VLGGSTAMPEGGLALRFAWEHFPKAAMAGLGIPPQIKLGRVFHPKKAAAFHRTMRQVLD